MKWRNNNGLCAILIIIKGIVHLYTWRCYQFWG